MADWDEDDEDVECPVCHHWQFGCLTCETAPLKQEIEELKAEIERLKNELAGKEENSCPQISATST